jgi:hypothetical protein
MEIPKCKSPTRESPRCHPAQISKELSTNKNAEYRVEDGSLATTSPIRNNEEKPVIQSPCLTAKASPYTPENKDEDSTDDETVCCEEDNADSPGSSSDMNNDLSSAKKVFIHEIMRCFWNPFNEEWNGRDTIAVDDCSTIITLSPTSNSASKESPQAKSSISTPTSQRQSQNSSSNIKRRRLDDEHDRQNDDEQDPKRPKWEQGSPSEDKSLKLACPFRKHNPRKYNMYHHKTCALSSFESIARLK